MQKAAPEERRHGARGLHGAAALSPVASARIASAVPATATSASTSADPKAPAPAAAAMTTIGRYIARFRYEQPLPREARSSVQKEDFWWKSGGSSPPHRSSRVRQRSMRESGAQEREGGDESDGGVSSLAMSGNLGGSVNSVKSGYERYIPEPQVHQEAYDTSAAVALDRYSPSVADVRAFGDSDALLVLSPASWSSLPSDLEPPSSSQESLPRELTKPSSRSSWKSPHNGYVHAHMHSDVVAVALGLQDDDKDKEDDDESKVEDAELVIERVRKRLGWSFSDDDSDAMSFKRYGVPSSLSPVSPMIAPWRRQPQRDSSLKLPLPAVSGRLSDGDEYDEILSGTMRVAGDSLEPTQVKPLQLALSELSSENRSQSQNQRELDVEILAHRAADLYSGSSSGDRKEVTKRSNPKGLSLDKLAGLTLRASLNDDVATIEVQRLDNHEDVTAQMEPSSQYHGYAPKQNTTTEVGAEELVSEEDVVEVHDEEANISDSSELKSGNDTVAASRSLQSIDSPVIPVWRRGSDSSFSPNSATSSSFPPRVLAPSPSSSASSPPRSSTQSSLSSVAAETAKTLDNLVSLVVRSWSNDSFFGAKNDDNDGDGAQEASESVEKETIGAGGNHEDGAVEDLAKHKDIRSVHKSVVEARDAPPLQVNDESSIESSGPPLLRDDPPVSSSLFNNLNGLQPIAGTDKNAVSVGMDSGAAGKSYGSEKEEGESAETGDDEDDEIVRLLLSRIAMYEEALQRLDAQNTLQRNKHGDADE